MEFNLSTNAPADRLALSPRGREEGISLHDNSQLERIEGVIGEVKYRKFVDSSDMESLRREMSSASFSARTQILLNRSIARAAAR